MQDITDQVQSGLNNLPNVQSQQQQQPQQQGNWFTRALPTIGSVAAPVIGALLAPETGGLSLLAGAALSGAGAGAGKAAENVAERKNVLEGVPQEATTSAALGGVLGGVGKGLGLAKGALIGEGKPLAGAIQKTATRTGSDLLQNQFGNTATKSDAQTIFNYGINNAEKFANEIHPKVGGADGAITQLYRNALGKASDNGLSINLTSLERTGPNNVGDTVKEATNSAGIANGSKQQANVQDIVSGALQKVNSVEEQLPLLKGKTVITQQQLANHDLTNALDLSKELQNRASTLLKSSSGDIQAQGLALRNIARTVEDNLNNTDLGTAGSQAIPQELRDQAIKNLEPLKTSAPRYYNAAVSAISDPEATISSLRSFNAPATRLSIAFQDKLANINQTPGITPKDLLAPAVGMSAGGIPGALVGYGVGKAAESQPAQVIATKLAQKAAGVPSLLEGQTAKEAAQSGKVKSTLGRINKLVTAGGALGTLPNMSIPPAGGAQAQQGDMMQQGLGQNNLQTLYNNLVAQEAASPAAFGNAGLGNVLSQIAPMVQQQALAGAAVRGLQPAFQAAGGGQGLFGGIESSILGQIPGTPQAEYQRQQAATSALLAKLYGIAPGQASQLTPTFTMSPGTAGMAQQGISNLLSTMPTQ
jgi:hypothetical protein